jgi:hypothetical protein
VRVVERIAEEVLGAARSPFSVCVTASSTHVPMSPSTGGFAATSVKPSASIVAPRALR